MKIVSSELSSEITENIVVAITVKSNVAKRDGKDYLTIDDMSVSTEVSNFKVDCKYNYVPSSITSMVSGVVNSNWEILKPLGDPTINRFVSELIRSVVTPMFDNVSFQDFFDMND